MDLQLHTIIDLVSEMQQTDGLFALWEADGAQTWSPVAKGTDSLHS